MIKRVLFINTILINVLISSCKNPNELKNTTPESINYQTDTLTLNNEQLLQAKVIVSKPLERQMGGTMHVFGKVEMPPQNLVSISVPLSGYVKYTDLLPGNAIKKGQLLCVLEDVQYIQLQQDFLIAKNQLQILQAEFKRQKTLLDSQASSLKNFMNAEVEFNNQQILISALKQKLSLINIYADSLNEKNISKQIQILSPINGFITKISFNIGKYAVPTESLFEIINMEDIHLNLKVFEKDLKWISVHQQVLTYTNGDMNKKHKGNIILINKSINEDGSVDVHCHFEQVPKNIFPGMFMNADILIKNKNCIALPEEAVVRFKNKNYVFIQEEKNNFIKTEIQIGMNENGFVEIIDSQKLTDKNIVTQGAYGMLMQLKNKD